MAKLPDFSKNLPEGWQDQSVFTFQGPDVDGAAHFLTLIVDRRAGDVELQEYAEEHIDAELEALPGMTVLASGIKTLPGEQKKYDVTYKWVSSDDKIIIRRQAFALDNGTGFIFSINYTKRSVKLLGGQVDQIIQSLITGESLDQIVR